MLSLLSVEEICRKLRPIFGKKIDEIYLNYTLADSRQSRDEIEQMLNILYRKHLSELLNEGILLEPPAEEAISGEYGLGIVSYAGKDLYKFNLKETDWIRHVCITGMSGSGKTNLAFHIIRNFIKNQKPFFIFDWKKSFRPLILADPEIRCFSIGNERISNFFKINISKPPKNVGTKEWLNVLCDLITETFSANFGVHKLISETLDEAFKDAGVYRGSGDYPSWYEIGYRLNDKLKHKKGREANWLESALRIAHVLTFGDFGKVINCKGEDLLSIEDLLDKKIIFEMSSLNNVEKTFFCGFLLTYLYKFKKANQEGVDEKFKQAIIVDEAHNIFLKDKPNFMKETITDTIYREIREYGISLVCLDQHISKLSSTVVGNSACHIAFQQQLPEDSYCIARVCHLERKEDNFSKLDVGEAIVKLAEHYHKPFLIKVLLSELKNKAVSDAEIKEKMSFYHKQIKTEKDKEFMIQLKQEPELDEAQKALLEEVRERINLGEKEKEIEEFFNELREYAEENNFKNPDNDINLVKSLVFPENDVTAKEQKIYKEEKPLKYYSIEDLDDEEKEFMYFLQKNKDMELYTTEIYKVLELSARKGIKIKNKLMDKGLIKISEIRDNKGRKKIIQLA